MWPPAAAHGQMSACLFISGYECVSLSLSASHTTWSTETGPCLHLLVHIAKGATPKIVPPVLSFHLTVPAYYLHSNVLRLSSSHALSLSSSFIFHLLINTSLVLSILWISPPSGPRKINTDSISPFLSSPPLCTHVLPVPSLTFHFICLRHQRTPAGFFINPQCMPSAYRLRLGCGFSRACGCGAATISPGFRSRLS